MSNTTHRKALEDARALTARLAEDINLAALKKSPEDVLDDLRKRAARVHRLAQIAYYDAASAEADQEERHA